MTHHFRASALLTVAALTSLVITGCGSTGSSAPATGTPGSAQSSGSAPATTQAPGTPATAQARATPGPPAHTTGLPAGYLPLFPFANLGGVRAWQASYESGGHQPWHLSPDITATAFAAFLGYTDVTQVAGSAVSRGDAHVAVGIKLPDGTISTAAVIHLVLFGSGQYSPWEVVGTSDITLTLDRPAYGSTVPSPVTAGAGGTAGEAGASHKDGPASPVSPGAMTVIARPAFKGDGLEQHAGRGADRAPAPVLPRT